MQLKKKREKEKEKEKDTKEKKKKKKKIYTKKESNRLIKSLVLYFDFADLSY